MFHQLLENVRKTTPLVHNITNYVTVNDCANILLACGASPIMADDVDEVEDIQSICGGLNINIGTLNRATIPAMFAAGVKANGCGHPVILDPVGAGASKLRTDTARRLLEQIQFTVIRGNISEIKTLALGSNSTKGVDADVGDVVTEATLEGVIVFAKRLAETTGAIVAITGAIDIVADARKAFVLRNGHPMMSRVTGTGCMLSAMIAAYLVANPEQWLEATAGAVCAMGLCGERAHARLTERDGNATYRNYIIDEAYRLTGDILDREAKYDIR